MNLVIAVVVIVALFIGKMTRLISKKYSMNTVERGDVPAELTKTHEFEGLIREE